MTAWVLMTAMPPTKGHLNLIRFAAKIGHDTKVLVCTQPEEPMPFERFSSVYVAVKSDPYLKDKVEVIHLHRTLEQDPQAPGFWEMWDKILLNRGFKAGDFNVTSEPYGATLAERLNGHFIPYDPGRELYYTKATNIRDQMAKYFADILPEFQHYLRTTVTIFGAESTGKTTLSSALAYELNGHWLFEWARPYLETVGPEITKESMRDIWIGQRATQLSAQEGLFDKPFIIQDTDLFSTVGYWNQPHWSADLGPVPLGLENGAKLYKSDLYLITKSNIPFEVDPLRYGGDRRESSDEYWIGQAEKYGLNYRVLESDNRADRLTEAVYYARQASDEKAKTISYDRHGL